MDRDPPNDRFVVEHVNAVDPITTKAYSVYLILDTYANPPTEFARCFTPQMATITCALLRAWNAFEPNVKGPYAQLACPQCGAYESTITDTRKTSDGTFRIRRCAACRGSYRTAEVLLESVSPGKDV